MHDVIIAGGGPVGLFLACELQLAGVSVLVLERMEDPHSPLKAGWMGMRGLNSPSVEAFYRRGLLEAVRAGALGWMNPDLKQGLEIQGVSDKGSALPPRFAGHFAGIMIELDLVDFSGWKYLVPSPSTGAGLVSLETIELLLAAHATELGVDVRRGMDVMDFEEDADGVTVRAGDESFRGRWLVGCDGGHSTVRKIADFEFAGTEPEFTGYTASATIADPEKLRAGFNVTEMGMYTMGPGSNRIGIVEFDNAAFDRTQTITLADLQGALRRVSGTDVTLTSVDVASTYTDRARQATTYRKGRVLLAGDAAHVHSPLGGQGLNTGIGDAMNLGWKLAATIRGWAPQGFLDSYTEERHPIGAWALDWTRAQVAIMRPERHARAMRSIVCDLMQTRDATSYFVEKMSGVSIRYDIGGDPPMTGCSAPDFEFEDGTRLGEYLHDGRGLLVDLTGSNALHHIGQQWADRVKYVSAKAGGANGLTAILVRPDGIIASAAESEVDPDVFAAGMERWFGDAV